MNKESKSFYPTGVFIQINHKKNTVCVVCKNSTIFSFVCLFCFHDELLSQESVLIELPQFSWPTTEFQNTVLAFWSSMHSAPPRLQYWDTALFTSPMQTQWLFWFLSTHHFEWSHDGFHPPASLEMSLTLYTLGRLISQKDLSRPCCPPHVWAKTSLLKCCPIAT